MSSRWSTRLALCLCVLFAIAARAVEDVRIAVRVASIAGGAVYLDRGRADGLLQGDRIVFALAGSSASGVVRATSKNGARVEMDPGSPLPPIGTGGEARVPADRVQPPTKPTVGAQQSPAQQRPSAPEPRAAPPPATQEPVVGDRREPQHPPWNAAPEEWSTDRPLLAPAFGSRAEERPTRVFGRAWIDFEHRQNSEGASARYDSSSIGADATVENPFHDGGTLRAGIEVHSRSGDALDPAFERDESGLRVDRLSYAIGGTEMRPNRFEIGRFLPREFPELGLLDGVEWSHVARSGTTFGASAGWLPEPFPARDSFQDLQAAVFWRQSLGRDGADNVGLAYQSTWHSGTPDRDLVLAQLETRIARDLEARLATWIDVYTSKDTREGSGVELTEARGSLTWRTSATSGIDLHAEHRTFPDMLRSEFLAVSADELARAKLDRAGVSAWADVTRSMRIDFRTDAWRDQDDDGITGELGATLREVLWRDGDIGATLVYADGSYSSGPGVRLLAVKHVGRVQATLGWQSYRFDQKDFTNQDVALAQHAAFATFDFALGARIDLSLFGDKSFGDRIDAWSAGLRLETGF